MLEESVDLNDIITIEDLDIIKQPSLLLKGYSKKNSFFKIGSAMLIQMAKGQLFPNP